MSNQPCRQFRVCAGCQKQKDASYFTEDDQLLEYRSCHIVFDLVRVSDWENEQVPQRCLRYMEQVVIGQEAVI